MPDFSPLAYLALGGGGGCAGAILGVLIEGGRRGTLIGAAIGAALGVGYVWWEEHVS